MIYTAGRHLKFFLCVRLFSQTSLCSSLEKAVLPLTPIRGAAYRLCFHGTGPAALGPPVLEPQTRRVRNRQLLFSSAEELQSRGIYRK